jgi:HSP20 family molecular chaperone IbpA
LDINIHYPEDFVASHPVYKQLLIGQDGVFRAAIDIHDFTPEEIKVKTVGHTITIQAMHDEKEDQYGIISRNFSKKYVLPPTMNMEGISSWTSNGVLYVKVPPIEAAILERIIHIKHDNDHQ